MRRLVPKHKLKETFHDLRQSGQRIVFTNGCFDLIHPGHLRLLELSASHGDVLVVAINDDDSVQRLKGSPQPIFPEKERAEILLSVVWVDYVTIFSEDTPLETIKLVRPHVLIKGAEYNEHEIVGADFVKECGGRVERIEMKSGYSSSSLIRKISNTT